MSIGPVQILLILVVVLIVFGAGKLPKVMGDVGSGIKNFKKGLNDQDSDDGKSKDVASENTSKSDSDEEKKS